MAQGPTAAIVMQLSLRYVKASLVYLTVGATLLLLSFTRVMPFEMTAFYFMQLYGFVAMMIFGLSYLFVPSFAHAFLHSLQLAKLQFWLMNIGVIGMTISFSGLVPYGPNTEVLVVGSMLILIAALYMHAYNLWQTMRGWKGSPGEKLAREFAGAKH
jgi:cbb3-type cytochrome oxidase subunit 1